MRPYYMNLIFPAFLGAVLFFLGFPITKTFALLYYLYIAGLVLDYGLGELPKRNPYTGAEIEYPEEFVSRWLTLIILCLVFFFFRGDSNIMCFISGSFLGFSMIYVARCTLYVG